MERIKNGHVHGVNSPPTKTAYSFAFIISQFNEQLRFYGLFQVWAVDGMALCLVPLHRGHSR